MYKQIIFFTLQVVGYMAKNACFYTSTVKRNIRFFKEKYKAVLLSRYYGLPGKRRRILTRLLVKLLNICCVALFNYRSFAEQKRRVCFARLRILCNQKKNVSKIFVQHYWRCCQAMLNEAGKHHSLYLVLCLCIVVLFYLK